MKNISFTTLIVILLSVLKLYGTITWSWWIILFPIWLPIFVGLIIILVIFVKLFIDRKFRG